MMCKANLLTIELINFHYNNIFLHAYGSHAYLSQLKGNFAPRGSRVID